MSNELDVLQAGLINISASTVGVASGNGIYDGAVITGPNGNGLTTTASNIELRDMTVPLKVHYRDKLHEFRLPAECTLKELYLALAKQLADIDPNGEMMLERQAEATYEVTLPPGTY